MKKTPFMIHAASAGEDVQLLWHITATLPALAEIIGEDESSMTRLTSVHLLSGITERMYAVAFKVRLLDDAITEETGKSVLRSGSCGRLWRGESAVARTLTPRDACNKIIHARWLYFPPSGIPSIPAGMVEISGLWRNAAWQAHLLVAKFARHCAQVMDEWDLIDNPRGDDIIRK